MTDKISPAVRFALIAAWEEAFAAGYEYRNVVDRYMDPDDDGPTPVRPPNPYILPREEQQS